MSIVCCREKAVLVAVYAERPRKRPIPSPSPRRRSHHHHHHHHHHVHVLHGTADPDRTTVIRGRGYNRRADLLEYARNLRASARPALTASSSVKRPRSVSRPRLSASVKRSPAVSRPKQSPLVQIIPVKTEKHSSPPACFGRWECLMPSFLRIITATKTRKEKRGNKGRKSLPGVTKMKVMVKSLVVKNNGNSVSKMFSKLRKRG